MESQLFQQFQKQVKQFHRLGVKGGGTQLWTNQLTLIIININYETQLWPIITYSSKDQRNINRKIFFSDIYRNHLELVPFNQSAKSIEQYFKWKVIKIKSIINDLK